MFTNGTMFLHISFGATFRLGLAPFSAVFKHFGSSVGKPACFRPGAGSLVFRRLSVPVELYVYVSLAEQTALFRFQ
jgi:hypothetical protein